MLSGMALALVKPTNVPTGNAAAMFSDFFSVSKRGRLHYAARSIKSAIC